MGQPDWESHGFYIDWSQWEGDWHATLYTVQYPTLHFNILFVCTSPSLLWSLCCFTVCFSSGCWESWEKMEGVQHLGAPYFRLCIVSTRYVTHGVLDDHLSTQSALHHLYLNSINVMISLQVWVSSCFRFEQVTALSLQNILLSRVSTWSLTAFWHSPQINTFQMKWARWGNITEPSNMSAWVPTVFRRWSDSEHYNVYVEY